MEKTIRVKRTCIKSRSQYEIKRSTIDKKIIRSLHKKHTTFRKKYGTPTCKPGQIIREGYMRHSYKRKNGTKIHSSRIKPGCITATGLSKRRGIKGKQLFVLQKGELTKYNYHANNNQNQRHESLRMAINSMNPLSVYRKLVALYVLNKNKNPVLANLYKNDSEWVKTTPEYVNRI